LEALAAAHGTEAQPAEKHFSANCLAKIYLQRLALRGGRDASRALGIDTGLPTA